MPSSLHSCSRLEALGGTRPINFPPRLKNTGTANDIIRPFAVRIPQEGLDQLRNRIIATRFPERERRYDVTHGVPLSTVQKVAHHWATDYDWRKVEAKLNSYPQFITKIDGLDIHFLHIRSKHGDALPVIITHGLPGSIIEQLKIIDALADPTAHGGKASDAFHVIIPSIPGYGFSDAPTTSGWNLERIAKAWIALVRRLGYSKFVASGGDWGAVITDLIGIEAPPELLGIHTNLPGVIPISIDQASFFGAPAPAGLSEEEKSVYGGLVNFYEHVYYAFEMGTRPLKLAALADSPMGLATFLLNHDARSLEIIARSFDGESEGITPDDFLDNVTMFWLTNTNVSAARLYWESKVGFFSPKGVKVPVAVSSFPDEIYRTPKKWAEAAYPNLIYYNQVEKGGHFAAFEQPMLLAAELRTGFRSLRGG